MRSFRTLAALCLGLCLSAPVAFAQSADPGEATSNHDLMIVFDGSNSMWGQIGGRAKVDIARDALGEVLSDLPPGLRLGMMVYGAERRGDCSDIVLSVPVAPASEVADEISRIAGELTPRGKTPLTDAVKRAAETIRYTENKATVVLITDGIESCEADPCALGRLLESEGIDFTAHVVGFGLSAEDGRKVACLADETGGRYLPAADAADLSQALIDTLMPVGIDPSDFETDEPAPEPAGAPVPVTLILRDAAGGHVLNARSFKSVTLTGPDGQTVTPNLSWERDFSAATELAPGRWTLSAERSRDDGSNISYTVGGLAFTVDTTTAAAPIELNLYASLKVETQLWPGRVVPPGTELPAASGGGRANYQLFPLGPDGMADKPVAKGTMGFDTPVAPGTYILRGTLARTITRDKVVRVRPGEETLFVFDFAVSEVFVTALTEDGTRVMDVPGGRNQTTFFYDRSDSKYFAKGGAPENSKGVRLPFYLPAGTWKVDAGAEGSGKLRGIMAFDVPAAGQSIEVTVPSGKLLDGTEIARLDAESNTRCLAMVGAENKACLVESPFVWADGKPTGEFAEGDGGPVTTPVATDVAPEPETETETETETNAAPALGAPATGTEPITIKRNGVIATLIWGEDAFATRAERISFGSSTQAKMDPKATSVDGLIGNPETRPAATPFTALGCGGEVIAWFDAVHAIDGDGPDLLVADGGGAEAMRISALTSDGDEVLLADFRGGAMAIDLADFPPLSAPVVGLRLTDLAKDCGNRTPGGDVDVVAVINGVAATPSATAEPATKTEGGFSLNGFAPEPEPQAEGGLAGLEPDIYGFVSDGALICENRWVDVFEDSISIGFADDSLVEFTCTPAADGRDCTASGAFKQGQPTDVPAIGSTLALTPKGAEMCLGGECEIIAPCPPFEEPGATPIAAEGAFDPALSGSWSMEGLCDNHVLVVGEDGRGAVRVNGMGWRSVLAFSCSGPASDTLCLPHELDGTGTVASATPRDNAGDNFIRFSMSEAGELRACDGSGGCEAVQQCTPDPERDQIPEFAQ